MHRCYSRVRPRPLILLTAKEPPLASARETSAGASPAPPPMASETSFGPAPSAAGCRSRWPVSAALARTWGIPPGEYLSPRQAVDRRRPSMPSRTGPIGRCYPRSARRPRGRPVTGPAHPCATGPLTRNAPGRNLAASCGSLQGKDDTQPERQRYECVACRRQFDDLSGTIYAGRRHRVRPRATGGPVPTPLARNGTDSSLRNAIPSIKWRASRSIDRITDRARVQCRPMIRGPSLAGSAP